MSASSTMRYTGAEIVICCAGNNKLDRSPAGTTSFKPNPMSSLQDFRRSQHMDR